MKYQSVLFASIQNSKTSKTPQPSPTRFQESSSFFFLPLQPRLSSISAFAQKGKSLQNTRWREKKTEKKTFCTMIDMPASFYYSCDVCPDTHARNCGLTLWLMQQSGDMRLSFLPTTWLEEA